LCELAIVPWLLVAEIRNCLANPNPVFSHSTSAVIIIIIIIIIII
jgi:hypothetical protein